MMNLYSVFVAASALACAEPVSGPAPVVLINVFEVPPARVEEAVTAWEAAHDFLRRQPGYVSTELHQALQPDARFQLVNVARWESPQTFQAATSRMRDSGIVPSVPEMIFTPALYRVVRDDSDGGCDETE